MNETNISDVKKKNSKGLIAVIVILLILVIALGSYIGYDKFLNKDSESASTTEKKSKNETTTNESKIEKAEDSDSENSNENVKNETTEYGSNKVKCYGTYYVNGNANEGIYTLKEDGTYQVENEEVFGVFTINENTITFIEMKHTTGPREEDPIYYNPKSYLIYDDCSRIRLTESGSHISAYLSKVN